MTVFQRYKYTIITVLFIVIFIGPMGAWRMSEREKCNDRGGAYVSSALGYVCVERR